MLSSHPTPPQPQLLRSIKHVFMCNECYHPIPPHPNPNCCVASNMCSCATNVIIPSHPTPTQLLRSIQHVFMCNECYHPIPPHPNPNCCVASNMCSCATNVNTSHPTPPQPRMTIYVTGAQENARFAAFPLGETRLRARRYVRPEPKTNKQIFPPLNLKNSFPAK